MDNQSNPVNPDFIEFLRKYGITANDARAWTIFQPHIIQKRVAALQGATRFVHYTTAEAAINIVRTREVWLRNTTCMNDVTEMEFGIKRVVDFWRGDQTAQFWNALDTLHAGLAQEIKELYDAWLSDLRFNTYMICVSEHCPKEDHTGRLSMWRAYGKSNGVALVFNPTAFHSTSDALGTYSYPVAYLTDSEVNTLFQSIVTKVTYDVAFLKMFSRPALVGYVHSMLEGFSLCLKHPGFKEEAEWRVVHRPRQNRSDRMRGHIGVIHGVPQRVFGLPLQNVPDEGLVGIEIPELVDRIILGPTQYPLVINGALVDELRAVGVEHPDLKVVASDIPLRI